MPDIVIHTAAHTDVNEGEILKDISYKVNFIGSWNIALLCQEYNKSLVFISSCGIFDGKKIDPYNELDMPNPLTHHHKSKYKAEAIIRAERQAKRKPAVFSLDSIERKEKYLNLMLLKKAHVWLIIF